MNPRCPECGPDSWKIGKNKELSGTNAQSVIRGLIKGTAPFHGRRFADEIVISDC